MDQLRGKTAFITGAASGIGLGLATVLGREGMRVVMADLRGDVVAERSRELADEGVETLALELDVSDREAMEKAARESEESFGQVDLVCNNAGVGGGGSLDECTYDDWDWVTGVNLDGVVNGVQTFVGRLKAQGGGHFVNTASMAGLLAAPGLGIYNTTKYAVVGLSETLRVDLEPHHIGVSVLCPGFVRTEIFQANERRPERFAVEGHDPDPDRHAEITAMVEAGIDPVEVGESVRDAVLANDFWVLTHPEFAAQVAERAQTLANAFEASQARLEKTGALAERLADPESATELWRSEE